MRHILLFAVLSLLVWFTQGKKKAFKMLNSNIFLSGYNWQPVFSDTFTWRACSAFEATKKNCPRGEPCMADLRSVHAICRDRALTQFCFC